MIRWLVTWQPGWPTDSPVRSVVTSEIKVTIGRGSSAFSVGASELRSLEPVEGADAAPDSMRTPHIAPGTGNAIAVPPEVPTTEKGES